jgi:hypothetical protein
MQCDACSTPASSCTRQGWLHHCPRFSIGRIVALAVLALSFGCSSGSGAPAEQNVASGGGTADGPRSIADCEWTCAQDTSDSCLCVRRYHPIAECWLPPTDSELVDACTPAPCCWWSSTLALDEAVVEHCWCRNLTAEECAAVEADGNTIVAECPSAPGSAPGG